uniref:Uncharacterized protein n=1 Tax=Anguilla anguilla TaxID=7936 RepID=A0A0E9WGB8_ANGAN
MGSLYEKASHITKTPFCTPAFSTTQQCNEGHTKGNLWKQ